jgi:hypothetical protein
MSYICKSSKSIFLKHKHANALTPLENVCIVGNEEKIKKDEVF